MYDLIKTPFGKYTRYTLQNPATGNAFSIVPERGANVLDITLHATPVLDGYPTPEALESAKFGKSAVLFPFPNRLDRGTYNWLGKTYQFPINNAATENAIHGFVRDEAFEVDYIFLAKDHASLACSFNYPGQRDYYPFPFRLEMEFLLHESGTFTVEVACRNLHTQPIPVGFGWHPYFHLTERVADHTLQLPPGERVAIHERMIPTGEQTPFTTFQRKKSIGTLELDNCFQVKREKGSYELALENGSQRLSVQANARQFPYFQVFTPPHRQSLALEPMTCNIDAFNNGQGLVTLEPQQEWKGKITITLNNPSPITYHS